MVATSLHFNTNKMFASIKINGSVFNFQFRVFFILIFSISTTLTAQEKIHQSTIDSLQLIINRESHLDKKAEIQIEQARYYYYQNHLLEQTEYLEFALENARESGNDSLVVECLLSLGNHRSDDPNFKDKTPLWCDEAIQLSKALNSDYLLVKSKLCKIAFESNIDLQKAYQNAKALENEVIEFKDNLLSGRFYILICGIALRINEIQESNNYALKGLSILHSDKSLISSDFKIRLYTLLGRSFMGFDLNLDKAHDYIDSAFQLVMLIRNVPLENFVRLALEVEYLHNGEYNLALENRQQMIINNGSKYLTLDDYGLFGYLSSQMKDYESAIEYFKKAYELCLDNKLYRNALVTTGYIIPCYIESSQFEQGKLHLNDMSKYVDKVTDSMTIAQYYHASAQLYSADKHYERAIGFYKDELVIQKKFNNSKNYTYVVIDVANAYLAIDQIDSAEFYIDLIFEDVKLGENKDLYKNACITKYKIFKKKRDYEPALIYLEKANELEAILYEEKLKVDLENERINIKVIESKDKVKKAEDLQRLAESEVQLLSQQKKLYIILAALLAAILLIGSYLFSKLRKSKKLIEDQKQHLERLSQTKDKFFGIIAHDIRSPIVALQSVGEQMNYYLEKQDNRKLKSLSKNVENTAEHLNGLLDNLLNWALLQQGIIPYSPKPIDLAELTEHIFNVFEVSSMIKEIKFTANIDANLKIFGDEPSIHTIFRNLVSNSIKYCNANDVISIDAKENEGAVIIKFSDTGIGMSKEKLDQILNLSLRSSKGTRGERGTGLGFNIVKEMVELNKGKLGVSSEIGKGTEIILTFPSLPKV